MGNRQRTREELEHWIQLRWSLLRDRAKFRCERCSQRLKRGHFHGHHLTYDNFGHEQPEDVEILCLRCHGSEHNKTFLSTAARKRRAARKAKGSPLISGKQLRRAIRQEKRRQKKMAGTKNKVWPAWARKPDA